jgi:hypothetical protein
MGKISHEINKIMNQSKHVLLVFSSVKNPYYNMSLVSLYSKETLTFLITSTTKKGKVKKKNVIKNTCFF